MRRASIFTGGRRHRFRHVRSGLGRLIK
jgi:hypothetical protein